MRPGGPTPFRAGPAPPAPVQPHDHDLVQALGRLGEVRALQVGDCDLSALPPRQVASFARYSEEAWGTQLTDLARGG